jgi:hypothetical protein
MLSHHGYRADGTTRQGSAHTPKPVDTRPNPEAVSAAGLTPALPTLREVAEFLELPISPERHDVADRALAYASGFESPPDRIAALLLAYAWLTARPSVRLHRPVSFDSTR